jgi:serine/threonine-protein kinase
MDWDDEDEKTNIYDKEETQQALASIKAPMPAAGLPPPSAPKPAAGALPPPSKPLGSAAALAAGSGGTAGALPPPMAPLPQMSAPPMSGGAPVSALPAPAPLPSRMDPTQVVRPSGGGKGGIIAGVGIALVAAAAGAFFLFGPKRGTVIVIAKSGGREVKSAQVFIDEKKVCDALPCRAPDIDKGTRTVKVVAAGFEPGSELVAVRAGEESPITIELARGRGDSSSPNDPSSSAAQIKGGTGFKATGAAHVKVSLDGKDLGPLPQEVKDATPGEHKIKFYSSDRYKADERTITIAENEVKDLGAVKLGVVKGKATLTLETLGSTVTLVSGADRKAVRTFPISLDIDTSKTWVIEATKSGFLDFKQPITFDDGEAEKTFSIALTEKGKPIKKDDDDKTPAKKDDDKTAAKTGDDKKDDKGSADSGQATLSINSIPPSNCILDGRPLGSTPKAGVSVSAGTHTVVFVHPEMGRKSASVTVKPGESRSVGVRF